MVSMRGSALLWLGLQLASEVHASAHHGSHLHLHHRQSNHEKYRRDGTSASAVTIPREPVGTHPPLPLGTPHPPPGYMRNNVNNYFGSAPDHGSMRGPVLGPLNSTELASIHNKIRSRSNTDDYWLSTMGNEGQMPFAPSNYQVFRNVKDFGAVGDGVTDDTAAINRAAATYGSSALDTLRCGADCGSTTVLGAVVYFPPGTYLISTPIIQYYYTQFVGNPNNRPTILGSENFTGIALFDSDFYIPGGSGSEWYINQSNFYRQIRNFVFDMTSMNWTNQDSGQSYVPAGIHWQVGQATSITNCDFTMSVSTADQAATAVGIYMENGSGGFVSDLTFTGGNIGFLAGGQQFTASNLQFTSCLTAIKSVWNWGFNWKNIYVLSCYVAIDATEFSGDEDQGTGSISVIDSHFNGVPYAITLATSDDEQPNIILDNLLVEDSDSVVLISGGATILAGSTDAQYINSWGNGYQYLPPGSGTGSKKTGYIDPAPTKSETLLDSSGAYFRQAKPQYGTDTPIVATANGVSNDGASDQTDAINSLLADNVGSVIFFPAGIYLVENTVKVPVGSRITGSAWSQIMGIGSAFADVDNPTVMVQVGEEGDSGTIEISDMLFTVKGATAGAILLEWNVREDAQGSAAMWDTHFRVGGANGTDLQVAECPAGATSVNEECMAASLLMHITSSASGYFENVWAWVADHDLDNPANADATESSDGIPENVATDVSIYVGRGILIESQGPTWLYGTASEHSQMYQYQLSNASTIYLGHIQTETPYYQPNPNALSPYIAGTADFSSDPTYTDCSDDLCRGAWALRILNSTEVFIYSAGFYSFFQNNQLGCVDENDCQLALIDTNFADALYLYNIFTKGNIQIISPQGDLPAVLSNSSTLDGYTTEIAAWLALATGGDDIGSSSNYSGVVTIDPSLWGETTASVACWDPCTYALPPITLDGDTTFVYPTLVTGVTIGTVVPITYTYLGDVTTTTEWESSIVTMTISIPPVTTSVVSLWEVTVTDNTTVFQPTASVIQTAFNITYPSANINGTTISASVGSFWPPPWPGSNVSSTSIPTSTTEGTSMTSDSSSQSGTVSGGSVTSGSTSTETSITGGGAGSTRRHHSIPPVYHTRGAPKPTCTSGSGCGESCNEGVVGILDSVFNVCSQCWTDCGGSDTPNGDTNPNVPKDSSTSSECSTATYSSCSTACVSVTTTSCSSTCKKIVGCDTTGTELSSVFTPAPVWTATPEDWADYDDDSASDTTEDWIAGVSVYSEDHTLTATVNSSATVLWGSSTTTGSSTGTGTTAQTGSKSTSLTGISSTTVPTVTESTDSVTNTYKFSSTSPSITTLTEIIEVSTFIEQVTTTSDAFVGVFSIAAAKFIEDAGHEDATISQYDLNFYTPYETKTVCSAGYLYNDGGVTTYRKSWTQIPESVEFASTITALGTEYSSCFYSNAAAPSTGDGGTLSCKSTSWLCAVTIGTVLKCESDELDGGYDTSIKELIGCAMYTKTTFIASSYTSTTTWATSWT